ncbi:MAG TPA: ABC transporter ATP-binding protein [Planctomycetota bacterium]|jgi:ATP-binding cassette subfamily B protein|nr:ABC transporter ATP-binding protein [Planctomycetota bacterium]
MRRELPFLLPYLRRHLAAYVIGSVCVVASIFLKLRIPAFLKDAFDVLEGSAGRGQQAREEVFAIALWIAAYALIVAILRTISRLMVLGSSRRLAHDLRAELFSHLTRLAPSFFVRNPTGQIMSRFLNDMQNVQGLVGPVIMYLAETLTLYAIAVPMMADIEPTLTLVALAPFPFFLYASRRMAVHIQEGSRTAQNCLGEISARVDESLEGQAVIKTLTLEEVVSERFEEHCARYRALNLSVTRKRALLIGLMMGLASLSTLIVLFLGTPRIVPADQSGFTLGSMLSLIFYLGMLTSPTRTLGFVISSVKRGAAALGRVREIIDSEVTLGDPPGGPPWPQVGPGAIELRGLTIRHPPLAEQPHLSGSRPTSAHTIAGEDSGRIVLEDVSVTVPAGTTLGIVGHTGAGKTTLVRALAGLQEVDPGQVFVDGVDITLMRPKDLRRAVGFVSQDAFLFSESVAQNVAYARPDATREEVSRALSIAQFDGDLAELPDGLDSILGERGVNLSGGQRQRTALARALLIEPPILILDDTISAVDAHTADGILAQLVPFCAGRTTLLVAHRLATLRHADQIIVLAEGRVIEAGTHDDLLAGDGFYATLWEHQAHREAREGEG